MRRRNVAHLGALLVIVGTVLALFGYLTTGLTTYCTAAGCIPPHDGGITGIAFNDFYPVVERGCNDCPLSLPITTGALVALLGTLVLGRLQAL